MLFGIRIVPAESLGVHRIMWLWNGNFGNINIYVYTGLCGSEMETSVT